MSRSQADTFEAYLELILKWNQRMNLTAIRNRAGILDRHFIECIACARALPVSISTLLDFGSGAGLPGIPISICRPELTVTLAESQTKKAAFLNEAIRTLDLSAHVFVGRAESISSTFDCVTLRAVDRMEEAINLAAALVSDGGWLAVMSTSEAREVAMRSAGEHFSWVDAIPLPGSDQGILILGKRVPRSDVPRGT